MRGELMTTRDLFKQRRAELRRKKTAKKPRRHSLVRQSFRDRLMSEWVDRRIEAALRRAEVER